jgi:splicing factor 3A subunit 2
MALGRTGQGPAPGVEWQNVQRKQRLAQVALETIDVKNDPYLMKNHLGQYECRLCLTLHKTPDNYLIHTQGKRHQSALGQRQHRILHQKGMAPLVPSQEKKKPEPKRVMRIGRPGYKVVKQKDPDTSQKSLLFQISYPKIDEGLRPRFRFMSAYEQQKETPNDSFQFLLFAADPYEIIAFKIPNIEIDKSPERLLTHWDEEKNVFTLQLFFKAEKRSADSSSSSNSNNNSKNNQEDDMESDAQNE